jgi:hypothetical protein
MARAPRAEKRARSRAGTFLREFVLPLVEGAELQVGRPLGADALAAAVALAAEGAVDGELERFGPDGLGATVDAIAAARGRLAEELWLYPVPLPLDEGALRLAVACHDLLFLSHPSAISSLGEEGALRVARFAGACLDLPAPRSDEELVARHTLVASFLSLERTDVEVRYWAGRRLFQGMTPPSRLLKWPRVRMVREAHHVQRWVETDLSEAQQGLLARLLDASPLTDLLSPARKTPPFAWTRHNVPWLARRDVARFLCRAYLGAGLPRVSRALARSFFLLDERSASVAEGWGRVGVAAPLVASLAVHLLAVGLVGDRQDAAALLAQDTGSSDDPTEWLASVLLAAIEAGLPVEEATRGDEAVLRGVLELAKAARAKLGPSVSGLLGSCAWVRERRAQGAAAPAGIGQGPAGVPRIS